MMSDAITADENCKSADNLNTSVLSPFQKVMENTEESQLVKEYETLARDLQARPSVPEPEATALLKRVSSHALSQSEELSRTALMALGVLLHRWPASASAADSTAAWLLPLLQRLLRQPTTEAKRQLVRAVWCLEALLVAGHLPGGKAEPLCDLVRQLLVFQLSRVQMRAVMLVRRAVEALAPRSAAGAAAVAPLLAHLWPLLLRADIQSVTGEVEQTLRAAAAVPAVRAAAAADLSALMTQSYLRHLQEAVAAPERGALALTAWALVIEFLGADLQRTALINGLLKVIELPFRSSNYDLRRRAFVAWRALVANFLANGRLHENAKRLKLLMTPLTTANANKLAVMLEKLRVWWDLLVGLGPHLHATFDTTTEPFLRFCFAGTRVGAEVVTSQVLQHPETQALARAALVQLLAPGCEQFAHNELAMRSHEAVTASVFSRHAALLADSAAACMQRVPAIGLADSLFRPLLVCVTLHLEAQAAVGLTREQGLPVTAVLRALDTVLAAPVSDGTEQVTEQVVGVVDQLVSCLPERFLWSSLHQMDDGAGGCTPALFLLRALSRRRWAAAADRAAVTRLVGSVGGDALRRLPELTQLVASAQPLQTDEDRLLVWTTLAEALLEHVEKTQEVDYGDALGHDFAPVARLLTVPLPWPAGQWLPLWSRLYRAALAAAELVPAAPQNALAAEVADKLRAVSPLPVPAAAACLKVLAETALLKDSDHVKTTGTPVKRRSQAASSLQSSLPQLAPLFLLLSDLSSQLGEAAAPEAVADLAEVVRRLSCLHVSPPVASAVVEKLGEVTASLLRVAPARSPARDKVLASYEALVSLVRHSLPHLSPAAVLAQLAPLLELAPAAEPSRRLWHRVLAPCRPAVPETLAPLLARLAPLVEASPGAPTPFVPRRIMAALSAEKERRQRAAGSPAKASTPPSSARPAAAKDDHEVFVVITPSPAGRRPLTEHQREVLAARRDNIPALYADLSQDTQQLAAAAAAAGAPDDSAPSQPPDAGDAAVRRTGARRRLLGVESQPAAGSAAGAVSFAGAVAAARGGAESEQVPAPARTQTQRRPRRLRQSLPAPQPPSPREAAPDAARLETGTTEHEGTVDNTAGEALDKKAAKAVETEKTADESTAKTAEEVVESAAERTSEEAAVGGEQSPAACPASGRPRRSTVRLPKVAAYIRGARRSPVDRRPAAAAERNGRRRRSEPLRRREAEEKSDDSVEAQWESAKLAAEPESAPAAMYNLDDSDDDRPLAGVQRSSTDTTDRERAVRRPAETAVESEFAPAAFENVDDCDADQTLAGLKSASAPAVCPSEAQSTPVSGAGSDGGRGRQSTAAAAAAARRARVRRRRSTAAEISESRLMEASPPEQPAAAAAREERTPPKLAAEERGTGEGQGKKQTKGESEPSKTAGLATSRKRTAEDGDVSEAGDPCEAGESARKRMAVTCAGQSPQKSETAANRHLSPQKRPVTQTSPQERAVPRTGTSMSASGQRNVTDTLSPAKVPVVLRSESDGRAVDRLVSVERPTLSPAECGSPRRATATAVVSQGISPELSAPVKTEVHTSAAGALTPGKVHQPVAAAAESAQEPAPRAAASPSTDPAKPPRRGRRSRRRFSEDGGRATTPGRRAARGTSRAGKRSPAKALRSRAHARRSLPAAVAAATVEVAEKNAEEATDALAEMTDGVDKRCLSAHGEEMLEKTVKIEEGENILEKDLGEEKSPSKPMIIKAAPAAAPAPEGSSESCLVTAKLPLPSSLPVTATSTGVDVQPPNEGAGGESRPAAADVVPDAAVAEQPASQESGTFEGTPLKCAVVRLSRLSDPLPGKVRRQLDVGESAQSPAAAQGKPSAGTESPTSTRAPSMGPTTPANQAESSALCPAAPAATTPSPAEVAATRMEPQTVAEDQQETVDGGAGPPSKKTKPSHPAAAAAETASPAVPAAATESEELFVSPEPAGGAPVLASRAARLVDLAQKRQAPPAGSPERQAPQPPPTPSTPVHNRAPWARHVYSPRASPSAGILKRRRLMNLPVTNSPPTPGKRRAVQFCDPPVSESVEIPPNDGSRARRVAAQRGLLLSAQEFTESPPPPAGATGGLCPALAACTDSVSVLVGRLSSSSWRSGLLRLLSARGISTVGDLATLPAPQLAELPVRSPRLQTVSLVLTEYLETWEKRTASDSQPKTVLGVPSSSEVGLQTSPPAQPSAASQTVWTRVADGTDASSQTAVPAPLCSTAQQTSAVERRSVGQQVAPAQQECATATDSPTRRTVGQQTAPPPRRHVGVQLAPKTCDAAVDCAPPPGCERAAQTDGDVLQMAREIVLAGGPEARRAALLLWKPVADLVSDLLSETV